MIDFIENTRFHLTEIIAMNLVIIFSFGGTRLYKGVAIIKITTKQINGSIIFEEIIFLFSTYCD